MYFQRRYLKEAASFDGTTCLQTVELPNKGLLSGLEIRAWGTCGTGADKPDVWLHDRIKRFEVIVNGSKVVKSLDGRQLLADMLHKRTPDYSHDMKNMSGASCEEFLHINFGRHYHDLEYMLDLSQVADPELRMDCDFTLTGQNGWTNGVAMGAAPSFSIIPHILRDPPVTPKGYIKTSELDRFTSASAKKENLKVPRGPVYSNLYLQSWYYAQGLGYLLDKVELNINSDDLIPLRVGPNELAAEVARMYGLLEMSQQVSLKGGQAYPFPIEQGVLRPAPMGLVAGHWSYLDLWGNAGAPGFKDISTGLTPDTNSYNVAFTCRGVWPFSVSPLPYFDPWDERTWIDSSALGDLWVRVEENTSGGTSAVIILLGDEVVTKYESV